MYSQRQVQVTSPRSPRLGQQTSVSQLAVQNINFQTPLRNYNHFIVFQQSRVNKHGSFTNMNKSSSKKLPKQIRRNSTQKLIIEQSPYYNSFKQNKSQRLKENYKKHIKQLGMSSLKYPSYEAVQRYQLSNMFKEVQQLRRDCHWIQNQTEELRNILKKQDKQEIQEVAKKLRDVLDIFGGSKQPYIDELQNLSVLQEIDWIKHKMLQFFKD